MHNRRSTVPAALGPWQALLPLSVAGWAALVLGGEWLFLPAYCAPSASFAAGGLAGIESAARFNPPAAMAAGWLTMLVAMMPLLLARPVRHVWESNLGGPRLRSLGLFAGGYIALWMAAGGFLLLYAASLHGLAGGSGPLPLLAAGSIALLWQASPWKRICLDGCSRRPAIASDGDALRFGFCHAGWCVGACWPLMALPLVAGGAHLAVMAAVTLLLLVERQRGNRGEKA
jgi:predicted metal-binding membrane protein